MKKSISIAVLALFAALGVQAQSPLSKVGGVTYASAYAHWTSTVQSSPTASGAATITLTSGIPSNPDGSQVNGAFQSPVGAIYTPIIVGLGTANQETVTPTAVSGCNSSGAGTATCNITATFSFSHGPGDIVVSGDAGIQEAINNTGSGIVVVDNTAGATDAMITATVVNPKITIEDTRQTAVQYWTPVGGTTAIGAPSTLTATTVGFGLNGANTTGGTYTGTSTYVYCVAYVDIMGQEGPCSATFSGATAGTGSTNQVGYAAPAASTGAVGYTVYLSLASGTYSLAYKVPLVTQPAAVGAYPVANGVCTLTTVETITPACAVTNSVYGSTGSNAVVSALTLSTSPIPPQATVVSTTSVYIPNPGGRTTYTYAPGLRAGIVGTVGATTPFTISAAAGTTVPSVLGTINLKPGFMNYVGKTIEVCGFLTTTASAATIEDVQLQWDSIGQNTAGKGVPLIDLTATTTLATTGHIGFCADLETTATSASATGGSINAVGGYEAVSGVSIAGTNAAGTNTITGATGSLNLAGEARINVIYLHTTGTDGAGWTLQGLTVKELN